ncbi:MAG: ubiquinone biosynthesis protein UbiH, partial [Sphingomonas bacterium]|nr:ubiquinone biosynthesis protein UbiH [Sphingomonas bacterium]
MSDIQRSDVIILGAGLVGCALALALARGGVTSILVDPAEPDAIRAASNDGRASAVSSSTWRMFD